MMANKPILYQSYRRRKGGINNHDSNMREYGELNGGYNLLDIGFGDGDSIINLSTDSPINIFGVDTYHVGFNKILELKSKKNLKDLYLIQGDIVDIIDSFPPNFFDKVHIFFPDPWPKRKHHKRRFLNEYFLEKLREKLKKDNQIHFASDHINFFLDTKKLISRFLNIEIEFLQNRVKRPVTKYELKALKNKHKVFEILFSL